MSAPSREEAWELFCEWTESDFLRKQVLGVEAAMRAYGRKYGEDEELWGVTGILTTSTTSAIPTDRVHRRRRRGPVRSVHSSACFKALGV